MMNIWNEEYLENLKIENLPSRNKNMEIKLENWTRSATKLSIKNLLHSILQISRKTFRETIVK